MRERERVILSVFRLTFILCISLEMFAYGCFVLLYNCYLFPTNSFCQMSYICYQSINKFVLKLNLYIIVFLSLFCLTPWGSSEGFWSPVRRPSVWKLLAFFYFFSGTARSNLTEFGITHPYTQYKGQMQASSDSVETMTPFPILSLQKELNVQHRNI